MRIVKYLTVWDFTVYNTLESKILDSFSNWRKQNLDVTEYVQNEKDYFGFAYNDTSDFAGLWCCSKECHYKWIPEYVFQGLVYDEDFIMYAIFDNKWNETRRVPIGCLDGDEVWQLSEMRTFS
ncbi:MAG: hypothetical protein ACLUOO_13050 [Coprococcus sp.]|jgi:hypothetical protein